MPPMLEASAMNYRLEEVWPEPPAAVREDVIRFWRAESAVQNPAVAEERSHQLLIVARDPRGRVAGVSTAMCVYVNTLGFECFLYRTFIGRAHRVRGLRSTNLVWEILSKSYRLLNERFLMGCEPDVLGLYAEIENVSIMRVREAVWPDRGMNAVYIGRTEDGRQIRIWYFDGAQIPRDFAR